MALLVPAWMQAASGDTDITYSAQQDRAGVLQSVFSREGVLNFDGGDLKVAQRAEGPNMSVDVGIGRSAIRGDDVSDQGTYVVTNTTKVNRSIPTSTSSSRTHLVIARVRDKLHNAGWTTYDWTIEVLTDTSAIGSIPSAVALARVTVPAGAGSVTNAMITDLRPRASVGTPWLTGSMDENGIHSAYGGRDQTRPLTWMKSPDGWVFLSGFIRRSAGNTGLTAGQIYYFDGVAASGAAATPMLPTDARPTGIRDVTMMTDLGPCNLAIYPQGGMSFRFKNAETLVQNQTWFSFDGVTFRAAAF